LKFTLVFSIPPSFDFYTDLLFKFSQLSSFIYFTLLSTPSMPCIGDAIQNDLQLIEIFNVTLPLTKQPTTVRLFTKRNSAWPSLVGNSLCTSGNWTMNMRDDPAS